VTHVTRKFRGSRQLVTGKSPTWIMLRGSHAEVFGFLDHRDMSRWFEKFP